MAQVLAINEIQSYVTQVAKTFDVKKVSLFGSYATGKNTKKSDIDLLVEFGDKATYLTVFNFQNEIESKIGREVDVVPAPIPGDSFLEIGKEVLLYEQA